MNLKMTFSETTLCTQTIRKFFLQYCNSIATVLPISDELNFTVNYKE